MLQNVVVSFTYAESVPISQQKRLNIQSTCQILLFEDAQRIREREEKEAAVKEKMVVENLDDAKGMKYQ